MTRRWSFAAPALVLGSAALALVSLGGVFGAQVTTFVGPQVAPPGCAITLGFSNDTDESIWHRVCPYRVLDSDGQVVFHPSCAAIAVETPPGGSFVRTWSQIGTFGGPIPPATMWSR